MQRCFNERDKIAKLKTSKLFSHNQNMLTIPGNDRSNLTCSSKTKIVCDLLRAKRVR